MKYLFTLTLTAVLAIGIVGCNKTQKVNASTTASLCDGVTCNPATCYKASCAAKAANCPLAGTPQCQWAAKKAASAKPAAAGKTLPCCANKANWKKAKPAATSDQKLNDCPFAGTPECPLAKKKAKPAGC